MSGRPAPVAAAEDHGGAAAWQPLPHVLLRGVRVDAISEAHLVEHVVDAMRLGRGGWIITLNLQHLHRCDVDPSYRALVARADVVVADGMPLVWASRLQGDALPERVAGSDLVTSLTAGVARERRSVYLLGGNPGAAEGAAAVLVERCPGLRIAGIDVPAPGFERDEEEIAAIRARLVDAAPDLVYVALGSPKQERLIEVMREACPSAWWVGVGISFSFLTGEVSRAPKLLRRVGLEWAHRFAQEPRRLFRRYAIEGVPFAVKLLASSALRR